MNKQNIKTWEEDGHLFAEWGDRSLDDDDRYAKDSIILTADVPVEEGEKALMARMCMVYDDWIDETRR